MAVGRLEDDQKLHRLIMLERFLRFEQDARDAHINGTARPPFYVVDAAVLQRPIDGVPALPGRRIHPGVLSANYATTCKVPDPGVF